MIPLRAFLQSCENRGLLFLHFSSLETPSDTDPRPNLRHISTPLSKSMMVGSIPANSVPTPFEIAAIVEDEESGESHHYNKK